MSANKWFRLNEKTKRFDASGHVFKTGAGGEVDIFATSGGSCNGPECINCGYSACWHCEPNPPKCTMAKKRSRK